MKIESKQSDWRRKAKAMKPNARCQNTHKEHNTAAYASGLSSKKKGKERKEDERRKKKSRGNNIGLWNQKGSMLNTVEQQQPAPRSCGETVAECSVRLHRIDILDITDRRAWCDGNIRLKPGNSQWPIARRTDRVERSFCCVIFGSISHTKQQ